MDTLYVRCDDFSRLRSTSVVLRVEFSTNSSNTFVVHPHAQLLGWSSTFGRGGMLKGDAVLFHRYGTELLQQERTLILAFDTHNHIGIEHSNLTKQSWGQWGTANMRDENIALNIQAHHIDVSIHEDWFRFSVNATMGSEDLYKHLSAAERFLSAGSVLTAPRTVLRGVLTNPEGVTIPAVCFYQGDTPPTPSNRSQ